MKTRNLGAFTIAVMLSSGIAFSNSLENACSVGNAEACGQLAQRYEEGKGVKQSFKQASIYYKKACENGRARACAGFARTHMANARQESWQYAKKACKQGIGNGCRYQAYILEQGNLRPKNLNAQIEKLLSKGCELKDSTSCLRLANRFARHEKTVSISLKYLEKACEYGNKVACERRQTLAKRQVKNSNQRNK